MSSPWSADKESVAKELGSDPAQGLSVAEAKERLAHYGENRLVMERRVTFWDVFKEEIREPMIVLLFVVGVFYSIWGELRDAATVFIIIAALILAEIITEYRAKRTVASLRRLSPQTAPVLRQGDQMAVPVVEIVPGDIVLLSVGDRVPADGRVIEAFGLETDESALTGESTPVSKEDGVTNEGAPLAERANMVFAGTTITKGRGKAIVTATGMATELGRITGLVLEAKEPKTPLQLAMKQLTKLLVWVAVGFSILIPAVGIFQGKPFREMILTGLSLSFATIPEELPIIITMVLGVGAYALSRKRVLIRRLRAAETLGSVSAIATDKTGTLTENRLRVASLVTDGKEAKFPPGTPSSTERLLLETGALSSNVRKTGDGYVGDPVEIALWEAATTAGIVPEGLRYGASLRQEYSFDNRRKMMSVIVERGKKTFLYAKGAPEAILERSSRLASGDSERDKSADDDKALRDLAGGAATTGLKMLALAYRELGQALPKDEGEAEKDMVFVGFVGLADPVRADVREALDETGHAGIRTIIISGDHPLTVRRVASEVGIPESARLLSGADFERLSEVEAKATLKEPSLFARTTPEQKLRIVSLLQDMGDTVAVTGDGINDAPALKKADIGIAMGKRGTEVAREAASMVLTDDSFSAIATGVREGRRMFDNLRKGVTYYLSVKISLVLAFLVPLFMSIPLPFAPIQIILLELFMDLAASATFVAEPLEPDVMRSPPRKREQKFIDRELLTNMSLACASLAAAVLINYLIVWRASPNTLEAQTIAFASWLLGSLFLAFTMRSQRKTLAGIGLFSNRVVLIWSGAAILFLVLATHVGVAQAALKLTNLTPQHWLMAIFIPFAAIFWLEIRKTVRAHLSRRSTIRPLPKSA